MTLMTIRSDAGTPAAWISLAATRLSAAGIVSPRHDAERLAAHALGVTWSGLWKRMLEPVDTAALDELCERRAGGEPLGYILGSVEFYGLEIACGRGVLVPRPETETLVDVALELIAGLTSPVVYDVGTGTGAVAIAIATRRRDARVFGTDVSTEALEWARRNAAAHGGAVTLVEGSMPRRGVDLVVSNPPYITDGTPLPRDVMAEPHEALFAGPRGDEMLVALAADAHRHKAVAFEVGTPAQADEVERLLARYGTTDIRSDHTGRPRVVCMRR